MAAMSDIEHEATGLELLLTEPEIVAWLGELPRTQSDKADDDDWEPVQAA
jgi:hypothetical protein